MIHWAKDHLSCVACGSTDSPHKARGLCSSCYEIDRNSVERRKEQKRAANRRYAAKQRSKGKNQ